MSNGVAGETVRSLRIGRSILALLTGFVVNVLLTLITDLALQAEGILPPLGHGAMNNSQAALAAAYRTLYAVIGSYVVARVAPYRPMAHALLGAGIGMLLATLGAVTTWNKDLGPHWYPLLIIALALPTGWAGAKLWLAQSRGTRN